MSSIEILKMLERKLVRLLPRKRHVIQGEEAVISFTFDDFPESAAQIGGKILARKNMAATYYLSAGIIGKKESNWANCSETDIQAVLEAGHELGCHTFSHMDCQHASASELEQDILANREFIRQKSGLDPSSFAYPLGKISFKARKVIGDHMPSARGISSGVNHGVCDLLNLKANSVYSKNFSPQTNRALLEKAIDTKGWLIFYTHDISKNPSEYGCTPEEFSEIVELVSAMNVRVLPVKHALGYFMF